MLDQKLCLQIRQLKVHNDIACVMPLNPTVTCIILNPYVSKIELWTVWSVVPDPTLSSVLQAVLQCFPLVCPKLVYWLASQEGLCSME